jgi:hypothetical protein
MTDQPLTPEERAELLRLAEAASALPWEAKDYGFHNGYVADAEGGDVADVMLGAENRALMSLADARYLAAAVNAAPRLVAEVERLRARLQTATRVIDDLVLAVCAQRGAGEGDVPP